MASKIGQLKPFMLEEKKEGASRTVSETTVNKWKGCILANVKKEEKWIPFISKKWKPKKVPNRGLTGSSADADSLQIDTLLEYISQYAPNALYRDITQRSTSLDEVWLLIRNWAGLKSSGSKQQTYYAVKHSFDPNGDLSHTDFFFTLRNAKEDCLLLSSDNGGKISFKGSIPKEDEDLTPTLESDIVLDWMDAVGGSNLVNNVFKTFAKELETESLADLRQRISDNMLSLNAPESDQVELARAYVSYPKNNKPRGNQFQTYRGGNYNQSYRGNVQNRSRKAFTPKFNSSFRPGSSLQPNSQTPDRNTGLPCKLCSATKPNQAFNHSIADCPQLNSYERQHVAGLVSTDDGELPNSSTDYPEYVYDLEEEDSNCSTFEDLSLENSTANACLTQVSNDVVVRINRVSIHDSPILACSANNRTIYLLLDTGATASIMSLKMTQLLNLQVFSTTHKAVQVDGQSQLPVLGEVHTSFSRGSITLTFSGLVVPNLGVDILAGTNFHVENDVYSRMSKGTIHIGDHCVVQSSPPSLLSLDSLTNKSHQRLVKVPKHTILLPGESLSLKAPPDIPPDSFVELEPNLSQAPAFFYPTISKLENGVATIQNVLSDPVKLKKNCQAVSLHTTSTCPSFPNRHPLDVQKPSLIPVTEIQKDVTFDGNLPAKTKQQLKDIISSHSEIFQPTLPGYNHSFGPVYADFNFASKARPVPQKLRFPNFGSHQYLLFNQKCQQLKYQGVLVDPIDQNIQPTLTHNSWVVKKPSSANKPWDKCTTQDVRLVVGLDPLNKFLADPPGKITKTDSIYSALASWEFMGELDFSDFYFQIKFRNSTEKDKSKLGYLCINITLRF